MRVLFLMFHGFSEHSGITKKIRGQIKGFEENGMDVDLAYYDSEISSWVIGNKSSLIQKKIRVAKLRNKVNFKSLQDYIVAQRYDLVYMRSYHNANPFTIKLVKRIRKSGSRIVIEIPTFPYDSEYYGFRMNIELFVDRLFRYRLMKEVDAVVTFSEDDEIFGQRTIRISNAIDFDAIPLRKYKVFDSAEVHLLGVAEIHYWHGFDRLVKGLGEYYQQNPSTKVFFHMVGNYSGDRERNEIEQVIEQYGLHDYVIRHGALYGRDLDELFDRCDFAIGSLGRHRTGIQRMQSLKNREYAARGMSFCYSESDPNMDGQPYVVKIPADESAVEIDTIISYLKSNSITKESIRSSVLDLSWNNQMKIILSKALN